ncbi:hypothetical protein KP612_06640 [Treponema denticola]|uniref:Uncharacterized protein n=1 Tax=Treponema denticola H-22 TaxID=999432 RepID=A0A0E2E6T9_TREDN|nr:hypothetical protein [Treponema denticola]EMB35386.1 hypothetical protein HMPREF9726_00527 [Treponema denticola H-22]
MLKLQFKQLYFLLLILTLSLILIIIFTSIYLNNNNKAESYFIDRIQDFEVYFVNNNYIFVSFAGNGSFLYGGIIHKDKFKNEEDLYFENIESRLNSEDGYKFKLNDYPDNAVIHIGNYDSDKNIEIFFYEFMGRSIELPIEITPLGKVQKQSVFNNVFLIFSIIMNMFFSYIFVFICCILVLAVLMTHMGIKFLWVIKK